MSVCAALIRIKHLQKKPFYPFKMEWQTITTAPFDRDLELAVIDGTGAHALVFPCRRVLRGWVKAQTNSPVNVYPTHWREWAGPVEKAPIGEPEEDRLGIIKEYANGLRAIIKKDRDELH